MTLEDNAPTSEGGKRGGSFIELIVMCVLFFCHRLHGLHGFLWINLILGEDCGVACGYCFAGSLSLVSPYVRRISLGILMLNCFCHGEHSLSRNDIMEFLMVPLPKFRKLKGDTRIETANCG